MDRFTARRKLLRGSLSAPLVLTVASPAALARQSFEACLDRARQNQAIPAAFIPPNTHDTWLRKQVPLYTGELKSGGGSQDFYMDGSFYYKVSPGDCSNPVGYGANDFKNNGPVRATYDGLALVYVNTDGQIMDYGPCPPFNAFPVSTSCWASFQAGQP